MTDPTGVLFPVDPQCSPQCSTLGARGIKLAASLEAGHQVLNDLKTNQQQQQQASEE